jgi:uncharacterized protein (DUF488 family)
MAKSPSTELRHRQHYREGDTVMELTESPSMRIVTIGAYGFDEEQFFRAIEQAGIDTFCDVRQRRGMRGSLYAFANSTRLQDRLRQLGIRYVHLKDLAPSDEIRAFQRAEDQRLSIAKRNREGLAESFVEAYRAQRLHDLDPLEFVRRIGPKARTVALFCVERRPEACHRSLLADFLARNLGARVEHLTP